MGGCKDCYNGCAETISDKCVKYTGPSIPQLGIETGDNLALVEADIIAALLSALNGSGIVLNINPADLCALVSGFLPPAGDIDLNAYVTALIKAICSLHTDVLSNAEDIAAIEAPYIMPSCLSSLGPNNTHNLLQATMNFVCILQADLSALELNLTTNYTPTIDLEDYIINVINNNPSEVVAQSAKMVPYTVVEYYGDLSFFDATGAGLIGGDWENIYLCNGANGTPDKRGRAAVGATNMLGAVVLDPAVDPGGPSGLTPDYTLLSTWGENGVQLTENTLPPHIHTAVTSSDGEHTHEYYIAATDRGYRTNRDDWPLDKKSLVETTPSGAHTHDVTVDPTGGGDYHNNIQPVLACYYIMYIPA